MSFTSDLSVSEFALAKETGLRPLRLVGGAGVFRLPPLTRKTDGGGLDLGEIVLLTDQADRWNHARGTVLDRLRDEARACGSDVVTGVSLRHRVPPLRPSRKEPADWYQEFTATGTAMARTGADTSGTAASRTGGAGPDTDGPELTNLRVQDYWKLIRGGCVPSGLVTVTVVAAGRSRWDFDPPPYPDQTARAQAAIPLGARERPEYHPLMRRAYSVALWKLKVAAARLGAAGVTAVEIERSRAEWSAQWSEQTAVFVHATGTAVTFASSVPEHPAPLTIMPVRHLDA